MRHHHRVLMLLENCSYPRDSRVRHEAEALTQAGYHVTVISPNLHAESPRETINGVKVCRFPAPPPANGAFGYFREYLLTSFWILLLSIWVLFRSGVDIVHAHNPPDVYFVLVPLLRLIGIRFVYDHHDLAPELYDARFEGSGSPLLHRLLCWCEGLSYRAASHVLVTNESYRLLAIERGKIPAKRITIVRNGPDELLLQPSAPHDGIVIGYVGSLGFHDGGEYLLSALDALIHVLKYRDFRCVIAGDGDAFDTLRSLARQLEITDWVEFRGWLTCEDVKQCLQQVDICAAPEPFNPYNDQSTMIKIMEYMAAGKPIVAFNLTEHRRSAGESAIYAQPNDVIDFARCLLALIRDPVRRERMGRIGQTRIASELAWHYQADALIRAYSSLTQQESHRLTHALHKL